MDIRNDTNIIKTMSPNMHYTSTSHPLLDITPGYSSNCAMYDFIISGIIIGISCFLGLVGNSVSFVILNNDPHRSVTTFLLTVLAIADFVFLIPVIFLYVLPGFCGFHHVWCSESLHAALPKADQYGWAVASMAHTFTIYITILVTYHRFICVCLPHQAPKLSTMLVAKRQVTLVAIFAIVYNIPRFLEFKVNVIIEKTSSNGASEFATVVSTLLNNGTSLNHSQTMNASGIFVDADSKRLKIITWRTLTELGRNNWYQIMYKNVFFYIFMYIIPLLSLIILTSKLAHALKKRQRFRFRFSVRSRTVQGCEDNITMVLIIVVIIFLICQTPTLFQRLFYTISGDEGQKCGHFFFYFERFADYLAILNSCINFIIYVMFVRRFRQVFWKSLKRKRHDKGRTLSKADDAERQSFTLDKLSQQCPDKITEDVRLSL